MPRKKVEIIDDEEVTGEPEAPKEKQGCPLCGGTETLDFNVGTRTVKFLSSITLGAQYGANSGKTMIQVICNKCRITYMKEA